MKYGIVNRIFNKISTVSVTTKKIDTLFRNSRAHEEMVRPYVFLEVLTKIKVVRHLIRPPMIFFPGYNAQVLTSYSQKTKQFHEKYAFLQCLMDCNEGSRRRKNTLSIAFERPSFLQYTTLNIFLFPLF